MASQASPQAPNQLWGAQDAAVPLLETLPSTVYSGSNPSSRPRPPLSQQGRAFTLHDDEMDLDSEITASASASTPTSMATPKTPAYAYSNNTSPTTEYSFAGNAVQDYQSQFQSKCPPLPLHFPPPASIHIPTANSRTMAPPPGSSSSAYIGIAPGIPDTTLACSVSYPSSEIRAMAEALHQARQTGEFPESRGSLFDAHAVANEYAMLAELRKARGNPANPPPAEYMRLRVDVARRLQERDAEAEVAAARAEAERRVNSYMRMVEHENQLFTEAGSALQRCGVEQDLAEHMVDVVEQAVADATAPIRLNANRIDGQVDRMDVVLSNYTDTQAAMLRHQFCHLDDHALRMNRHVDRLETHAHHLDSHADSLRKSSLAAECQMDALRSMIHTQATTQDVLNDSLRRGNRLADSFDNMLNSLPAAVARASSTTIDAHVQAAVERALREQHHDRHNPASLPQPLRHREPNWPSKLDRPPPRLPSSRASGQPVAVQSILDQHIAFAARDELEYQHKEAGRGGIKKMFSKFLRGDRPGRRQDDLPPWVRTSSKIPFG